MVGPIAALLDRIESFRKPDGGYEGDRALAQGTAYGAFVALGAAQPGKIVYGSSGSGSFVHLAMALLNATTNTKKSC